MVSTIIYYYLHLKNSWLNIFFVNVKKLGLHKTIITIMLHSKSHVNLVQNAYANEINKIHNFIRYLINYFICKIKSEKILLLHIINNTKCFLKLNKILKKTIQYKLIEFELLCFEFIFLSLLNLSIYTWKKYLKILKNELKFIISLVKNERQ